MSPLEGLRSASMNEFANSHTMLVAARSVRFRILHNNELHLSGKLFDTVTRAGTVHLSYKNRLRGKDYRDRVQAWFTESNLVATHCPQPYPIGEPVGEVYKQTLIVGKTGSGSEASASYNDDRYRMWTKRLQGSLAPADFGLFYEDEPELLLKLAEGRTLILTEIGYLGLAPLGTQVGDTVCVLQGVPMPIILRPSSSYFKLVGECYMHGLMKGELMVDKDIAVRDIVLI